ncbi:MAG: ribosome small subunit-dependent GTPase A [Calditrichaeota bacterium]|nr:ribosome small subunit-dependent GTPase A [Calditrichota bacterium]MBT7789840.1 ribosome small subunit-dependent GTPase A [Calditrichota bacterium]
MNITQLGWGTFFQQEYEGFGGGQDLIPARVTRQDKNSYELLYERGSLTAQVSGAFSYTAESASEYPTVGDWVIVNVIEDEKKAIIHKLLPRKSSFTRKAAGVETEAQIVAANVDIVFMVVGLDRNFNLRRIERYLTLINKSGAKMVIVLNKSDLCDETEERIEEVENISGDAPVITMSATCDDDFSQIERYIEEGKTVTLVGSSGTGKSTIINRLLGEERLLVKQTSEHVSQGRHTTTWRELVVLPSGGIVIDTPGMREIQLWADDEDLANAFGDIEELAEGCRFRDCEHLAEPGCAVQQAIEDGKLEDKRLQNYRKMGKEIRFMEKRKRERAILDKNFGKQIHKFHKHKKKVIF